MSSNGRAVRQICDPNDEAGRTTGEVKAEVHPCPYAYAYPYAYPYPYPYPHPYP